MALSITISTLFPSQLSTQLLPQLRGVGREHFEFDALGIGAAGPDGVIKIFGDLVEARQKREVDPVLEFLAVLGHPESSGEWESAEEAGQRTRFLFQNIQRIAHAFTIVLKTQQAVAQACPFLGRFLLSGGLAEAF